MSETSTDEDTQFTRLEYLKNQRKALLGQITRIKNYLDQNLKEMTESDLQVRLDSLEKYFKKFDSVQCKIETCDSKELEGDKREKFENAFFQTKAKILDKIREFSVNNKTVSRTENLADNSISVLHPSNVTLEKLKLPTFDGNIREWKQFYETFNKFVHDDTEKSDIEKFTHLRNCLKGSASKAIECLEITSVNYVKAIEILKKRFGSDRALLQIHLKELFELEHVTKNNCIQLRNLLDNILPHIRSLSTLAKKERLYDTVLIYLISSKIDLQSRFEWEKELSSDKLPELEEFIEFLSKRCQVLEGISDASKNSSEIPKSRSRKSAFVSAKIRSCALCSTPNHLIYNCKRFANLPVDQRLKEVIRLDLCRNCLKRGHNVKSCLSLRCRKCNNSHHTLLHPESPTSSLIQTVTYEEVNKAGPSNTSSIQNASLSGDIQSPKASYITNGDLNNQIVLATALVRAFNPETSSNMLCRCLLDSASQLNFVSERVAQLLKLRRIRIDSAIAGIGSTGIRAKYMASLKIQSCLTAVSFNINVIILPRITEQQPEKWIDLQQLAIPEYVQLADPEFYKPQHIDILLGAQVFFEVLGSNKMRLNSSPVILQSTDFGWVLSGRLSPRSVSLTTCNIPIAPCSPAEDLNKTLQRFWELEAVPEALKNWTFEETSCEQHFQQTVSRDSSGRFIVRLPFREAPSRLGNSYDAAYKRFINLEKRLSRDGNLKVEYSAFMQEYARLGHMQPIRLHEVPDTHFYLPHHCVMKHDSTSTKLRAVFDASSKSDTGLSLNDILMVGPVIQQDLFSILCRFRTYKYVFTADISKMYRQVLIHPEDRAMQLILWRDNPCDDISIFQLNTVTYGTAPASFLATRCLKQLSLDNAKMHKDACRAIDQDFYVDDIVTGADTVTKAQSLQRDLSKILSSGCFELRKWCANNPHLLKGIPTCHQETQFLFNNNDAIKPLGLIWQPHEDKFYFQVSKLTYSGMLTKRNVLSDAARTFDPLGLLAPIVIVAKIFLQELWRLKLGWDEALPIDLQEKWKKFRQSMEMVDKFCVPRYTLSLNRNLDITLHGFCDASEKAYGACAYLRCVDNHQNISVNLLCAKSRVAPIKVESIPRLELCAAELLAKLVSKVSSCLRINIDNAYCYTDSMIVLAWLSSASSSWHTFVANRVSTIQQLTNQCIWQHIDTNNNPADLISRGLLPPQFAESDLWFHGPRFLLEKELVLSKPQTLPSFTDTELERRKVHSVLNATNYDDILLRTKFHNSFDSLQHIFAYCYRFVCSITKLSVNKSSTLSPQELDKGLQWIIKIVQRNKFAEEITYWERHQTIPEKSCLKSLDVFLDESNLLRVGGRLRHSSLPYHAKHQIVLPKGHHFTKLLIKHYHEKYLHAGPIALLAILRNRFWIINGKSQVREVIHKCIKCFKTRPKEIIQLMGNLPRSRTEMRRPFYNTGVDFCGPFHTHYRIRGKTPTKSYVAVFVCFSTRAVHLELTTDLTSGAFIAALKRFISRRGLCANLYSDNATNFVGANSELQQLKKDFFSVKTQEDIRNICAKDMITWHMIPPRSPHFGGLWEAAVKTAKFHMYRIFGNASLTFEELNTVIIQVEAVLNSRPLTPLSCSPNDLEVLTPAHFLIGEPFFTFPEPDISEVKTNILRRWDRVKQLHQHFWHRWSGEYLLEMQRRAKWRSRLPNIKLNALVLIKEDNLPPLKWLMGRVIQVYPGKDGLIRVAEVKTKQGILRRPIVKLCPLPMEDNVDDTEQKV